MRRFNHILGFVAVGFVLVFLGKVSKTSLYSAYFRTIADVEVRNSHSLDSGGAHVVAALTPKATQSLDTHPQPTVGDVPSHSQPSLPLALPLNLSSCEAAGTASMGLRCFLDIAPRAPGA